MTGTVLKLTGLAYGDLDKLRETICPGNAVFIGREPEYDKPEGKAYVAMCKGLKLGYIPLLDTLRGYYKEAHTQDARGRIAQWGNACNCVRIWLESREKYNSEVEWVVWVKTLLYDHDGVHTEVDNGKVCAVAVLFKEVVP